MTKRDSVDLAEITRQYVELGLGLRQIARLHGVSHEAVRGWLLGAGVQLRPRAETAEVDGPEILLRLMAQGFTVVDLATMYAVSQQTIYRRLGASY
jgi:transposase